MTNPIQNDVTPFKQYTATGGQTVFVYDFIIYTSTDLDVYKKGASATPDDAGQLLAPGVDYAVTGVGVQAGGTIVLTIGATLNDIITVKRKLPLSRMTEFIQGNLTPESLNLEFNALLGMIQDMNMALAKIIPGYNFSGIFNQVNMKLPQLGPNQLWQMNSAGTGIQTIALTETDPGALILRADLASHAESKGASLVGLEDGQTVQEFADSLTDNVIYGHDSSETPNEVTVTFAPPIEAYAEDMIFLVRIANDNTGASTVNFDEKGELPLQYMAGQDLLEGDLLVGKVAIMTYVANEDSAYVQLLNPDFEGQIPEIVTPKPLCASVYLGSDYPANGGTSKVPFSNVEFDDNSIWDSDAKSFVMNKIGKWEVNLNLFFTTSALLTGIALVYVNGVLGKTLGGVVIGSATSVGLGATGSVILKTTAITDTVEAYIVSSGSSGQLLVKSGITRSSFQIKYLGENTE